MGKSLARNEFEPPKKIAKGRGWDNLVLKLAVVWNKNRVFVLQS
jgi:hypothetical protein